MDFELYKEQLIESFKTYKNKIEESEAYIRLREKYDTLPQNAQKAIVYGGIFLAVYFVYSIPASFVSSSKEKMEFFDENRQLTRNLIRAGRIARTVQLPPPAPTIDSLTNQVEGKLTAERILQEQKTASAPKEDVAAKTLVPKSIKQAGLKTTIKQLNLKQVIKFGESINRINGTKLMNIAIQADDKDPHYFNVDYELAAFSVPQPKPTAPKDKKGKRSKFKSRFNKKKNKDKK